MILNLNDKNKNKVISELYNFCLKHGLKLQKMHRAMKFEPKEILKTHMEFNSDKRKNARNDFEKAIFKLLNNALKRSWWW